MADTTLKGTLRVGAIEGIDGEAVLFPDIPIRNVSDTITVNPDEEDKDIVFHSSVSGGNIRFVYERDNDRVRLVQFIQGDQTPAKGESATNFLVNTFVDGTTTGSQYSLIGLGFVSRATLGSGGTPGNGSFIAEGINVQVYKYNSSGGGSGKSEVGGHFNVMNARAAETNHNVNYWFLDWSMHGPASGQPYFVGGQYYLANYHATLTHDADHRGVFGMVVTSVPHSGGGLDDDKTAYPTYACDAAFAVNGWAGPAAATDGSHASATAAFTHAFAAGYDGGPWYVYGKTSKIKTGFAAKHHTDYGLLVEVRHGANTGHAIYTAPDAGNVGLGTAPHSTIRVMIDAYARILRTDADAAGPTLDLYHDSASPAASDLLGNFRVFGRDSGGNETEYHNVQFILDDPTNASEDSSIVFQQRVAGTLGSVFSIKGDRLRLHNTHTVATAADSGLTGEFTFDDDHIFVCTATNTWKRAALSTW